MNTPPPPGYRLVIEDWPISGFPQPSLRYEPDPGYWERLEIEEYWKDRVIVDEVAYLPRDLFDELDLANMYSLGYQRPWNGWLMVHPTENDKRAYLQSGIARVLASKVREQGIVCMIEQLLL
jgi:hypothetical protein